MKTFVLFCCSYSEVLWISWSFTSSLICMYAYMWINIYIFAFTWIKYLDNITWRLNINQEPHYSLSMSLPTVFCYAYRITPSRVPELRLLQYCIEILKSEITWSIREKFHKEERSVFFLHGCKVLKWSAWRWHSMASKAKSRSLTLHLKSSCRPHFCMLERSSCSYKIRIGKGKILRLLPQDTPIYLLPAVQCGILG